MPQAPVPTWKLHGGARKRDKSGGAKNELMNYFCIHYMKCINDDLFAFLSTFLHQETQSMTYILFLMPAVKLASAYQNNVT